MPRHRGLNSTIVPFGKANDRAGVGMTSEVSIEPRISHELRCERQSKGGYDLLIFCMSCLFVAEFLGYVGNKGMLNGQLKQKSAASLLRDIRLNVENRNG